MAERAIGLLEGEGQVTVSRWLGEAIEVDFVAVHDGRAGRARATALDDAHLKRAARAAGLFARQARAWPAPALPAPAAATGRALDGFDPVALQAGPPGVEAGLELAWRPAVGWEAIASTTGVRSAEERSRVVARVRGRRGNRVAEASAAAVGAPDVAQAAAEVRALLGEGEAVGPFALAVPPRAAAHGPGRSLALGPEAVATLLERVRDRFGVGAALGAGLATGERVAAPLIELTDAPHHPDTLPRAFDAEGMPRRPVNLIEAGLALGRVHDSASAHAAGATSTGHATRALTLAPRAENLVLGGGEARDVAQLCAEMGHGVFVPAVERVAGGLVAVGAARVERGAAVGLLSGAPVDLDPLAVLSATVALTRARRLVALPSGGSALVPALLARRT